ncbi:MAG TPA: hypothetical protein VFI95_07105 [Terriglobales bacterium]|nr:hypothetical protein [Terriglobales bacterium]
MTAKAWYWTALTLLAASFASSGTGKCLLGSASRAFDQLHLRAMPSVAVLEMALGRTQAGYSHMESAMAQVDAQRARMQAQQARMQAVQAQLEAAAAIREIKPMRFVVDVPALPKAAIHCPNLEDAPAQILRERRNLVVSPEPAINVDITTPDVPVVHDPI